LRNIPSADHRTSLVAACDWEAENGQTEW